MLRPAPLDPPAGLARPIAALMLSRFAINTALRSPLPFLGLIAAAFGQSAGNASWLSAALGLAGLLAPVAGLLGQRFGQRRMLILPLAAFGLAAASLALAPTLGTVLAVFVALSVCKALFDPQMQGFIGDRVPYARRGLVIGIVELTWALSWAIGVPVFGFLAVRVAWWAPFQVMGGLALVGAVALWITARKVLRPADPDARLSLAPWRSVWANPNARRFMVYSFGIVFAAQAPYLVYPVWIQTQFKLSIEDIGVASIILGLADLLGEVLVATVADRLGKRRLLLAACAAFVLSYGAWWALSGSLAGMLAGLFLVYLCFETTLVAGLSVASELVPEARAAMMGFNAAAQAIGRVSASLLALALFGADQRLWLVALACGLCAGLALVAGRSATRGST